MEELSNSGEEWFGEDFFKKCQRERKLKTVLLVRFKQETPARGAIHKEKKCQWSSARKPETRGKIILSLQTDRTLTQQDKSAADYTGHHGENPPMVKTLFPTEMKITQTPQAGRTKIFYQNWQKVLQF